MLLKLLNSNKFQMDYRSTHNIETSKVLEENMNEFCFTSNRRKGFLGYDSKSRYNKRLIHFTQ